jgi:uncharacterized protein YjiS (DUF1127 family)
MHAPLNPAASRPLLETSGQPPIARWTAWLRHCLVQLTERRRLKELSDDQLRDVGLSRADIARACRRRPWNTRAWD